nr:MAG TPA: hypothetical protein [Caudoviricetes sp.]
MSRPKNLSIHNLAHFEDALQQGFILIFECLDAFKLRRLRVGVFRLWLRVMDIRVIYIAIVRDIAIREHLYHRHAVVGFWYIFSVVPAKHDTSRQNTPVVRKI